MELIHFVDPGLIKRLTTDRQFNIVQAKQKVIEQINWMAQEDVDAILITCTNYIALLEESDLKLSLPIIKLDELLFHYLCCLTTPQILLFSNAATVEGTMNRLVQFANNLGIHHSILSDIEVHIVEDSFALLLQGEQQQYTEKITTYIKQLLVDQPDKPISVAQLSMVDAAQQIEQQISVRIGTPLHGLVDYSWERE
jgi:hypothetical protein